MESLIDVIADVLEIPAGDLVEDTGPKTLSEWTSLKHIQLVIALEENYEVSFSSREIRALLSVAEVRRTLLEKGAAV